MRMKMENTINSSSAFDNAVLSDSMFLYHHPYANSTVMYKTLSYASPVEWESQTDEEMSNAEWLKNRVKEICNYWRD